MTAPPRSDDAVPPRKKRRYNEQTEAEWRSNSGDEERPACLSCRRRKAKCSRQHPCSQCERLSVVCTYDDRRRPGMKTGAVEALNQRLSVLEHMFLGQGLLLQPLLARSVGDGVAADMSAPAEQAERLKQHYLRTIASAEPHDVPSAARPVSYDNVDEPDHLNTDALLPAEDVLATLIEWYFDNIHRWIPILHVRRFREILRAQPRRPGVENILLAVTSLCLKFHRPGDPQAKTIGLRCRYAVILRSMERFSVENLQALVIIALDIIASGRGPSAWSVVGSIARTVEQLQLSTEEPQGPHSSSSGDFLLRRMSFLRPAKTWTDEEERRRVFWTVFTMDRFCSVVTGWNNSLTCADVRRRLPCEGAIWEAGNRVETPFFGIAERPSKIQHSSTPTSERHPASEEEVDAIGGFAFCIEATETLNLVTRFFLDHAISFKDPQHIQLWLIRFKELDLRLVKWRLFLPQKWRNASVLNQDGVMDPNLTLAHVTHNTAVIQLHQNIAFPSAEWRSSQVSLPSASSLDACVTAASEIGSIAQQFLQQNTGVTHPQLSFCLFVAGRVLLVHSLSVGAPLHQAFDSISSALSETARLWTVPDHSSGNVVSEENLASRLSKRLVEAREALQGCGEARSQPSTLDIRQPVYYEDAEGSRAASVVPNGVGNESRQALQSKNQPSGSPGVQHYNPIDHSPDSVSMAFPPLPLSFDPAMAAGYQPYLDTMAQSYPDNTFDGLFGIFSDQYEKGMRVSTYDEQAPSTANGRV